MFEVIASAYPRTCAAMRRLYGLTPAETADCIVAARYGQRAALWTARPGDRARAMLANAFASRVRIGAAR